MKDTNLIAILLCRTQLVEYYLAKVFVIHEQNSKNLSIVTNEVKQIIHVICIHDSDFVMACYTAIIPVANTLKKLHIMADLDFGSIHNFYNYKQ